MFIYAKYNNRDLLINTKKIIEAYVEQNIFYIVYELANSVQTAELDIKINNLRELQKILNS